MKAQSYQAVINWFRARPAAARLLRAASRGAVAAVYAVYLAMLAVQAMRLRSLALWAPLAVVPAGAFLLGTALRAAINRPRPYTALGFAPLFPKDTAGESMPSRHCFSAAAIAVAVWHYSPPAGMALAVLAAWIAVSRVLVGHHYISDVAAGLAFGALAALCGMALCGGWAPG